MVGLGGWAGGAGWQGSASAGLGASTLRSGWVVQRCTAAKQRNIRACNPFLPMCLLPAHGADSPCPSRPCAMLARYGGQPGGCTSPPTARAPTQDGSPDRPRCPCCTGCGLAQRLAAGRRPPPAGAGCRGWGASTWCDDGPACTAAGRLCDAACTLAGRCAALRRSGPAAGHAAGQRGFAGRPAGGAGTPGRAARTGAGSGQRFDGAGRLSAVQPRYSRTLLDEARQQWWQRRCAVLCCAAAPGRTARRCRRPLGPGTQP